MQQLLAAFGINGKLLIAQAVNFGLLLVVLTYFFYRPLMRILEERRNIVTKGVDDAARAAEKLASADTLAAAHVAEAEVAAGHILKAAREEAGTERSRLVKEAEARAAAIAADAQARAEEVAAKTQRDSEKEIARLAILAAERVLRNQ
ncbi:MAG: hypothetical protein B7X04_01955 [Parcubacteria group bacterium 21-54-25]|nr:MAG: hypothetical protein B7X04_01955 [Parcubacteria group bacterium 21-54-25]HQU07663.1 hypothetical protein [Candidatus Paceibacterota bacterium]